MSLLLIISMGSVCLSVSFEQDEDVNEIFLVACCNVAAHRHRKEHQSCYVGSHPLTASMEFWSKVTKIVVYDEVVYGRRLT